MMRAWEYIPGVPSGGHVTARGWWHPGPIDGCRKCPQIIIVQAADIDRCPLRSLSPEHYRADGNCRCQPRLVDSDDNGE